MRNWIGILIILTASAFTLPNTSRAGETTGNGSDNLLISERVAWFLGEDREIRYCWVIGSDQPLDSAAFAAAAQDAFRAWTDYLRVKKVNHSLVGYQSALPMATRTRALSNCDGTEDVKFYVGTTDAKVDALRAKHSNPTAFAAKTDFSFEQHWGKGIVWLASVGSIGSVVTPGLIRSFPDWNDAGQLRTILMHEIGHIYGCEHVTGTIMDENISQTLMDNLDHTARFATIDDMHELFVCWECELNYSGGFGWNPGSGSQPNLTFREWFGHEAAGDPVVETTLKGPAWGKQLTLTVQDGSGTSKIELQPDQINERPYFGNQGLLFATLGQQVSEGTVRTVLMSLVHSGAVLYYHATASDGTVHPVMIEINGRGIGWGGPLTVRYYGARGVNTLFVGSMN